MRLGPSYNPYCNRALQYRHAQALGSHVQPSVKIGPSLFHAEKWIELLYLMIEAFLASTHYHDHLPQLLSSFATGPSKWLTDDDAFGSFY